MCLSKFPIGQYKTHKMGDDRNKNIEFLNNLIAAKKYFIAEVEFNLKNVRYSIIPYKNEENMLIYPTNGNYFDVYTSVDIAEMLRYGGELIDSKYVIYWDESEFIFHDTVNEIYKIKADAKKNGNKGLESVAKLMLNSPYGKFSQCINDMRKISNEKTHDEDTQLLNGQFRSSIKIADEEQYCTYISAFVLSHARRIMNQAIDTVGIENIYYSDTDSIYLSRNAFYNSGFKESSELGAFKNDYDDKFISHALFAGFKRYCLCFTDGTYKIKCNGLNMKDEDVNISFFAGTMCKVNKVIDQFKRLISKETLNIVMNKWERKVNKEISDIMRCDVEINKKEFSFNANNEKRAIWVPKITNKVYKGCEIVEINNVSYYFGINEVTRDVYCGDMSYELIDDEYYPLGYKFDVLEYKDNIKYKECVYTEKVKINYMKRIGDTNIWDNKPPKCGTKEKIINCEKINYGCFVSALYKNTEYKTLKQQYDKKTETLTYYLVDKIGFEKMLSAEELKDYHIIGIIVSLPEHNEMISTRITPFMQERLTLQLKNII